MSTFVLAVIFALKIAYGQDVDCFDYLECEGDTINTGDANCYGYQSCKDASISTGLGNAYLYGMESGLDAHVNGPGNLYVHGLRGFQDGKSFADYTSVEGYFGALNADIRNYDVREPFIVRLEGKFSGWGADITCRNLVWGTTGKTKLTVTCGEELGCFLTDIYCYSGCDCSYTCEESLASQCPTVYGGPQGGLTDVEIKEIYEKNKVNKKDRYPFDPYTANPDDYDPDDFRPKIIDPKRIPIDGTSDEYRFMILTNSTQLTALAIFMVLIMVVLIIMCIYYIKMAYTKTSATESWK